MDDLGSPFDALTVQEHAVAAAQVLDREAIWDDVEHCMATGDLRVVELQTTVGTPAEKEVTRDEQDGVGLVSE